MSTDTEPTTTDRDPRLCSHQRDDGTYCRSYRVKGESLCAGHLGLGLAANPKGYGAKGHATQQQQAQERQEEAHKARLGYQALLAARLEEHADEMVARLLDIIRNGSDADALRALEQMANRVLGRPTERVETTQAEPATTEALRQMTREERQALLRSLEEQGRLRLVEGTGL